MKSQEDQEVISHADVDYILLDKFTLQAVVS